MGVIQKATLEGPRGQDGTRQNCKMGQELKTAKSKTTQKMGRAGPMYRKSAC